MIVFAHAGHWIVSVVYAAPAIGILAWVTVTTLRDRRRQAEKEEEERKRP
jgi:hypothetical protein